MSKAVRFASLCLVVAGLADALLLHRAVIAAQARAPFCMACLRIRVGTPRVQQGPSSNAPDQPFTELSLPNGQFRGFTAAGTTYAIDGPGPGTMTGKEVPVLGPAKAGSYGESGRWINHVERVGSRVFGFVHDETGDKPEMGLKSMSLAISSDDGLHWTDQGEIIKDKETVTQGKITGEGDCWVSNGQDGFFYAYCHRNLDDRVILARAPIQYPGPGKWMKWFNGGWTQPGLGGDATPLTKGNRSTTSYWRTTGQTVMMTTEGLGFSSDHFNFKFLTEPLVTTNPAHWNRPDKDELIAYQNLLDQKTGQTNLSNEWMLTYLYVQPNEGFGKRYLVFRPVEVTVTDKPETAQIGVLLTRWYNPRLHDHWSTTAAVPPSSTAGPYMVEKQTGYVMTAPDSTRESVELADCVAPAGTGHLDHLLARRTGCSAGHYTVLRTAGWVYAQNQPDTVPLYRCYSDADKSHFASNQPDCEGIAKQEALLGYALTK